MSFFRLLPFPLFFILFSLCGMLFLFIGCGTTQEHRVRQYQRTFDGYTPEQQQNLRDSVVKVGYTRRMVYIALGEPAMYTAGVDKHEASVWQYYGYKESHTADNSMITFRTTNDHRLAVPGHPREYEYLMVVFEQDEVVSLGFRRAN